LRFLANENFPAAAVASLGAAGHDVVWVRTVAPGMPDPEVLAWAAREPRILLTFDKDFGELARESALSFSEESFDAVLCNLGLILFPDPVPGLSEFRRVLLPGGRTAASVNTVVERSCNYQINVIIVRYVPRLAESVTRTFALAEASRLQLVFDEASCADFETPHGEPTFVLLPFDAYSVPLNGVALPPVKRWPHL